MNVLVTGATGFIGRNLAKRLIELGGYNVFCLVRNPAKAKIFESLPAKLIYADITNFDSLGKVYDYNFDIIFHCAGYVKNGNPKLLQAVNVVGTKNICELAFRSGVKRMVYLSSVAVISGNTQVPLTEDLPFKATNKYGQSKIEAERTVLDYRAKGLSVVIIRPCMVYGEDEPHMMRLLLFLLRFRILPIIDEGKNKFHLAYVKNVVEAMIFSLTKSEFTKGSFFIADQEILSSQEVFKIFSKAIGVKPSFSLPAFLKPLLLNLPYFGKRLKFFLKDRVYSIERLKSLGFVPSYKAEPSLSKSASWFINN